MIITEKDITKIVKFVINEISDTTAQFGWATKYAQEHYTKERIAFAEQCAEEIKNKIKDGEVSPTPQDVKLAVKKLFSEYEKMGNNSFIYDSLGYVVDLVMSDEGIYRTYKQNSYKKMVLSKISKNEKTKTKSKILFDYFEKNGVSEKPKVIAQKFQEQGINITPNDVSVTKNRFLGLKFANNMLAKPIEIVREWFYSTGGNTIDKNDENYPQEICEKIGEYHDTAAYAIRGVKVMQLLMENDGSVFYDFIQMLRFYNGLKYSCDNIRLLYYVAMYFDKKVPKQITSLLSSSDIENYLKQISLSKGRSVTPTICTKYLKSWGFNPYEKITKNNCETLIQFLFEKFGSDNISFINGLINLTTIIKEKGDRIQSPSNVLDLCDALWLLLYIVGLDSYAQINIENVIKKKCSKISCEQISSIISTACEALLYKIEKPIFDIFESIEEVSGYNDLSVLYNPLCNISQHEIYQIINRYYQKYGGMLDTPYTSKLGTPIEAILETVSEFNFLIGSVPPEKYGGESVFNFKNLSNPNFKAFDAIKMIDESVFPKAKKRIQKLFQNGNASDVSFFELVRDDIKIKEKTQREVFMFLIANTHTKWIWEYNNSKSGKQTDKTLGQKSIDMMCSDKGITYCVEYQGEQHFRPLNTKPSEDDANINEIKNLVWSSFNEILNEFGGNIKRAKEESKQKIINILFSYSNSHLEGNEILRELNSWLKDSLSKRIDISQLFKKSDRFPNYILSPQRFMDEIDCMLGKQRDAEKMRAVHSNGWKMIYVLPGSTTITESDIEYAKSLNPDAMFRWNAEGKVELLSYLSSIGIRRVDESILGTLLSELLFS